MKKIFLITIVLLLEFKIQAQVCCGCYEQFEIIDNKKSEKPIAKFCFDKKGVSISATKYGEKENYEIAGLFPLINKEEIDKAYQLFKAKKRVRKDNVIYTFENKKHIYTFDKDDKILEFSEIEAPFSTKKTTFYYNNQNELSLIVAYFEGNKITKTRQFLYEIDRFQEIVIQNNQYKFFEYLPTENDK